MGEEDRQGPHLHEQDLFWKDDQGDRWGSPAPDKGPTYANLGAKFDFLSLPTDCIRA